jgi:hypothetical protein
MACTMKKNERGFFGVATGLVSAGHDEGAHKRQGRRCGGLQAESVVFNHQILPR